MIGTTISYYEIIEKLGEGGMGEVYLAEDTRLNRRVALKFLPSSTASDPDARERLLREARAASKLHHPNIVTIHSIEEHEGKDFIVMEYVEGVPITQYASTNKLSSIDLNATLRQLCDGLHHAHTSGVVHRDLKPDNILVEADGRVRIMDFGVAILSGTPRLTQAGSMVGTTAYVSPEQVRGQDADARSDLFSLGVLMYELVAGTHPFAGPHEAATLYSIAHDDPAPLAEVAPDVSSTLAGVINKCLSKKPEERYASAKDVSDRLIETSRVADLEVPVTRYAKSGTTNIAYQVFGSGSVDLVLVFGWVSHVELIWQHHFSRDFLERLGKRYRVMIFDKRGTGLSDRVAELPPLEQRMDDVRAVMDAADSKRAVLMGISEGGPMCALFAATYPDRTVGLIIYGSYPVRIRDEEFPWGPSWEERERVIADVEQNWGGSMDVADLAPSESGNSEYMKWMATYFRQSASPGAAAALLRMNAHLDIRSILPTIRAQTLILHRTGDRDVAVQCGRYMAEQIPGARFVELEGEDHLPWVGDVGSIHEAIDRFVEMIQSPKVSDTALLTVLRLTTESADTDRWKSLVQEACKMHSPRQIYFEPDGAIVLFEGPIRSLKAAGEMGTQLSRAGVPWSIGLHSGECTLSGEVATGVAVQVAYRLADQGKDGAVRLTSTVRELVAGSGFEFVDAGDVVVPGINYTWHVVELPVVHPQVAPKSSPSIAVLPFTNMSADPENEYFSDGLTEELINVLARNRDLKVTGRTSSFVFKGERKDLREIGRVLGVNTLLEGSVRKSGNRVRITTQLIKVEDGFHIWTESYDRVLDDIFAVQDDIASAVGLALNVALLGHASPKRKGSSKAYNLILQANHFVTRNSKDDLQKAVKLYKQALDLDPESARAWAGLAKVTGYQSGQGFIERSEGYPIALDAAHKALKMDDTEPKAHEAMGWIRFLFEFNWAETRKHFERAHELAPGDSPLLIALATLEVCVGNNTRAMELALKGVDLEPLDAQSYRELARMYSASNDLENAAACFQKSLELSPDIVVAHSSCSMIYMRMGDIDRAIEEANKEKSEGYRLYALASIYHVAGRAEESDQMLDELINGDGGGVSWAFQIAFVYAVRNELDASFRWLDRSYELRDIGAVLIKSVNAFENLRSDPRYEAFLKKMGLTP